MYVIQPRVGGTLSSTGVDLSRVDLSQLRNTIVQFRVGARTKLLYTLLPDSKKRVVKQLLERVIEKLSTTAEIPEVAEVRRVDLDIAISGVGEGVLLTEKLRVCEDRLGLLTEKLRVSEDKLKVLEGRLKEYEEELERLRKFQASVVRVVTQHYQGVIPGATLLSELRKLVGLPTGSKK